LECVFLQHKRAGDGSPFPFTGRDPSAKDTLARISASAKAEALSGSPGRTPSTLQIVTQSSQQVRTPGMCAYSPFYQVLVPRFRKYRTHCPRLRAAVGTAVYCAIVESPPDAKQGFLADRPRRGSRATPGQHSGQRWTSRAVFRPFASSRVAPMPQ
jgi:hypothetical protein